MSSNSKIQWTDSTFNPWWGCVKVHEGCKFCYAERDSNRYGFKLWGPRSERRTFGDKHWAEPVKWNKQAESEGLRHRVFCASMADVFEDHPALPEQRKRLFDLICRTPYLDWQVLTKRPEHALRMMVEAGLYAGENVAGENVACPQPNLWIGTSPCNQGTLNESLPHLLRVPAAIRFLSLEPLLGPVDLGPCSDIDWVIVGGESGHHARPCFLQWIASIVTQCREAGIPVFVKQFGAFVIRSDPARRLKLLHSKGGDPDEWPADLRVREFPPAAKGVRR